MANAGPILLILAIVALVAVAIWLKFKYDQQRREEFFRTATKLGLAYSVDDPFHTDDLPFDLFRRGDGRRVDNVMHGTAAGMRVRLFDFEYYETVHNPKGPDTRHYYRFSSALAEVEADCPHLTLAREGVLSRLADHLGFRDIEFESEEFNKAWQVKSEDARFASAFVDPRMMEWLLGEGEIAQYEVVGPLLLCSTDRVKPAEYENLLEVMRRFHEHVPAVVSSLYPRETRKAGT